MGEPTALAIAMFIAIPAGGGWLMAYFIDRWQPWWVQNQRRTAIASLAIVPVALAGVGIVPGVVIVATAIVAVGAQVDVLRSIAKHVALRVAVCLGFAGLMVLALADLTDDMRTLL